MSTTLEIRNRWTSAVQFSCDLSAEVAGKPIRFQLGFAVKKAVDIHADLRDADLRDAVLIRAVLRDADLRDADLRDAVLIRAVLRDADLRDADLIRAVLRGAVLSRADLSRAVLRSFKSDLWMTLTQNSHEVAALVDAIREGRVDGSTYHGECACLVGTIANARGISHEDLEHNPSNPAEQWFAMIHAGDKPGDDSAGGFAAQKALEWTIEWCALNGVEVVA